jgi:hypothetical protein
MSVQILERPNQLFIPAYGGETIFTVAETTPATYNNTNFKFVFDINIYNKDENGDVQNNYHRFSVKPKVSSGWSIASFDIAQVVQDYATTDTEIYTGTNGGQHNGVTATPIPTTRFSIHTVDKFSKQRSNMLKVQVAVYEYYTDASGNDVFASFTALGLNYAYFNGTQQLEEGATAFDDAKYLASDNTKSFLSSFSHSIERKIRLTDYHTLAFTNGRYRDNLGTVGYAKLHTIEFRFYDSNNTLLQTSTIENNPTNGGSFNGTIDINDINETHGLLIYAGVGCKNITNAGITIPANTAYYKVRGENTGLFGATRDYTFRLQDDDCKGFETIRLAYLNRLGAWDYYNFTKRSVRSVNTKHGLMKESTVAYGNAYASRQSWRGGAKAYRTNSVEVIEANTDFITEDEANVLEELFTSPQVYMQDLSNTIDTFLPVVVTEKKYTKQTTANDGLKQYVISIEKSNNKVIQRL